MKLLLRTVILNLEKTKENNFPPKPRSFRRKLRGRCRRLQYNVLKNEKKLYSYYSYRHIYFLLYTVILLSKKKDRICLL